MSFSTLQLHPSLLSAVDALGYTEPTPIQVKAIPAVREGRDLLACAMTGSGKTAAFLLPILHQLLTGRGPRHPLVQRPPARRATRVLVLTPTRELAAQILADVQALSRGTKLRAAAIFGGVGMGPQERALRDGVDVLVATPGRLLDHLGRPYGRLDAVEHLVLDEADRMLDMGFLPDIKRVLARLPEPRQTLLFSATMPDPIVKLSKGMLRDPLRIDVERRAAPATGITQAVYPVPQTVKPALLLALLDRTMKEALVFTRTKHRADRVARFLVKAGVNAERLHGNRTQGQRTRALDGFKSGEIRVLVATDIAARGIDVEALGHVVNFDVPHVPEDYIHRVGRTGRASATGEAFTFVSPDEEQDLRDIERAVGRALPRVVLEDFDYTPPPGGESGAGGQGARPAKRVKGAVAGASGARGGRGGKPGAGGGGSKRVGAGRAGKGRKHGARGAAATSGGGTRGASGGASPGPRGIGAIERGRPTKRSRF